MEHVPEPPPFKPLGLPEGVFRHTDLPDELRTTRADFCDPQIERRDGRVIFNLHTVNLYEDYDEATVIAPEGVSLEDVAIDDRLLRKRINDRTQARRAKEIQHQEAQARKRWQDPYPDPPLRVVMTGQDTNGLKIGIVMHYRPACQVQMPPVPGALQSFKSILPKLARRLKIAPQDIGIRPHLSKRFKGWESKSAAEPCVRKQHIFCQVSFPNQKAMKFGARILREGGSGIPKYEVFEDRIDGDAKFVDHYGLEPSAMHYIEGDYVKRRLHVEGRELKTDYEYVLGKNARVVPLTEVDDVTGARPDDMASLSVAVVDGEMDSGIPGRFPRSWRDDNPTIAFALVFAFAGALPSKLKRKFPAAEEYVEYERRVFVLSDHCAPIPGCIVELFDDEMELTACVCDELFARKKIDVLVGHNHTKFDIKYLYERVDKYAKGPSRHAQRFKRFGAMLLDSMPLKHKRLNSPALGTNNLYTMNGAGFVYLDTLLLCKQYHKFRENSLKYVCKAMLKDEDGEKMNKFDMPYDLICEAAKGGPEDWRKLAAYCVQDCVLPLRLIKKWDSVKDLVAQSRIITILMASNVMCGQQQRVRNSMMKKAHAEGFVMNGVNEYRKNGAAGQSALGGWVLDNIQGLHDKPIVVLDFASLYPSMQRRYNLCWSTVVDEDSGITSEHEANGLEVETFETATGTFRIVQNVPGVFPEQLTDLLNARKGFKGEMKKHAYGTPGYQNADNAQKATKIVMNSGYGTANCDYGIMPCKAVGTITCAMGREANQVADKYCQEHFGTTTIYGDTDSIMVYFPEPDHIKNGTRKERLKYAMDMGLKAEKQVNAFFNSDVVKTECEKVYFPYLSSGKKTYVGLKFEPGKVDGCDDDLRNNPDKDPSLTGGRIEAKGIRTVRRDVPLFCKDLSDELFDALFYQRDLELFWDTVHSYTERVVHDELDIEAYVMTAELKEGYDKQASTPAQAAVSYAREYKTRGAAFDLGDRIPFVFVEEADRQRVVRPPWMNESGAAADADFTEETKKLRKQAGKSAETKAMCARHPEEVAANPDKNHIDIVYYVEKGVVSVLKQLMPHEVEEQKRLIEYAKTYQRMYISERSKDAKGSLVKAFGFEGTNIKGVRQRGPKLPHKAPKGSDTSKMHSLAGLMAAVDVPECDEETSVKTMKRAKPFKSGPPIRRLKQGSLLSMLSPGPE